MHEELSGEKKSTTASAEEEVLAFWKEHNIFEKTISKKAPKGDFVFYEGPPTANGKPGIHHLEARAFKDAIPRYKTMRGYRVERRAGWDTHGLPVELQVEKELGFTGKKDIEDYGIAEFNKKCRESVVAYIDQWAKFTKRIGYWVDETKAYFTFNASYMEVLWNIFAKTEKAGRLYKDYKIVPWCSRCGTALSAHELAQGYDQVKDITITAKFELLDQPGTFLLAWTTTPWTLPSNIALAIGKDIEYGMYEKDGERVIVADSRAKHVLSEEWRRTKDVQTKELIGKKYQPLYPFARALADKEEQEKFGKAYEIYQADFVTTEEGTGVVHTAVMYGQEDFDLGTSLGLPKVHLVSPEGIFVAGTDFLESRKVTDEDLTIDIIKDLAHRGALFSKEKYEHTYPFCWRCKTRIIYYARDSWYIRMTDLRGTLVAENKKVHWEPAYIRDGRMGEWLKGAKDWAISRERYWGTPLPIWTDASGVERIVIDSIDMLKKHIKRSGNTYHAMRHGESEKNIKNIVSSNRTENGLTPKGNDEIRVSVAHLKKEGIDVIYTSPLVRTMETAEVAAEVLGIPKDEIIVDERLREIDFGSLSDRPFSEFREYIDSHDFLTPMPSGESYEDVRKRFADFLYDLEEARTNTRILIVTHGVGLESFDVTTQGGGVSDFVKIVESSNFKTGAVHTFNFIPLPHNEDFELDLHRPYIDDVVLSSKNGKALKRVPEVMDVWFDSGAMPFAQSADDRGVESINTFLKNVSYPADYISEAIDQTRGWFYTLLAVGVLSGRGRAYKNVISLGHLLDAKGQKMSKSKGNVVEPWKEIEQHGADALRFWMYFVNAPGDTKNYDQKTIKEAAKVLSWIENSANFYNLYKEANQNGKSVLPTDRILDEWARIRTEETRAKVTRAMDEYQLHIAAREIARFAEDLSQWYVRRIRERIREGDQEALNTLRHILHTTALMLAPLAPFLSERVFQSVRSEHDAESVHIASWPMPSLRSRTKRALTSRANRILIEQMERVRALTSDALQLRQRSGMKVRQPLHKLSVPDLLPDTLIHILKDEVNVKQVRTGASAVELDTALTPELIKEGDVREFARALADARKSQNLSQRDKVHLSVSANGEKVLSGIVLTGVSNVTFDATGDAKYIAILSECKVSFSITKDAT